MYMSFYKNVAATLEATNPLEVYDKLEDLIY